MKIKCINHTIASVENQTKLNDLVKQNFSEFKEYHKEKYDNTEFKNLYLHHIISDTIFDSSHTNQTITKIKEIKDFVYDNDVVGHKFSYGIGSAMFTDFGNLVDLIGHIYNSETFFNERYWTTKNAVSKNPSKTINIDTDIPHLINSSMSFDKWGILESKLIELLDLVKFETSDLIVFKIGNEKHHQTAREFYKLWASMLYDVVEVIRIERLKFQKFLQSEIAKIFNF